MSKELTQELQEKLDALGSTPLEEPKIYKKIQEQEENGITPIITLILTKDEIMKLPMDQVSLFVNKVITKVSSFKDADENYKTTPNTKECDMPNPFQADELYLLAKKGADIVAQSQSTDKKIPSQALEEMQGHHTKIDDLVYEIANIKKADLSDWEQGLMKEMMLASVKNFREHSLGKRR